MLTLTSWPKKFPKFCSTNGKVLYNFFPPNNICLTDGITTSWITTSGYVITQLSNQSKCWMLCKKSHWCFWPRTRTDFGICTRPLMVKKSWVGKHICCCIISLCQIAGLGAKRLPSGKLSAFELSLTCKWCMPSPGRWSNRLNPGRFWNIGVCRDEQQEMERRKVKQRMLWFFQPLNPFPNCSQETVRKCWFFSYSALPCKKKTWLAILNITFNHLYSFTRPPYKSFSLTLCWVRGSSPGLGWCWVGLWLGLGWPADWPPLSLASSEGPDSCCSQGNCVTAEPKREDGNVWGHSHHLRQVH